MGTVKIVVEGDLDGKTIVVGEEGKVGVKVYRDIIATRGILTMDSAGRFVMKDALEALSMPDKRDIGVITIKPAQDYINSIGAGGVVSFNNTSRARYYALTFNLANALPTFSGGKVTIKRFNAAENVAPIMWIDREGQEVFPGGVSAIYSDFQLLVNITDLLEFNNTAAEVALIFKHWDDTKLYLFSYDNFPGEVRQGLSGVRLTFDPVVNKDLIDYPDSNADVFAETSFSLRVV